ncbi:MAG: hypothetical protein WD874_01595, partial [Parcubacteria group bacterium]
MNIPVAAFAATLSVDLRANGENSLTLTDSTASFNVNLSTTGATACQLTSPTASGISIDSSMTIEPGHPWYPAMNGSTTFTVTCTDGVTNATDSVVVSLTSAPTPPASSPVTADIKANGSDGPTVTISSGSSYTYSWSSTNATACQLTSPASSGIS